MTTLIPPRPDIPGATGVRCPMCGSASHVEPYSSERKAVNLALAGPLALGTIGKQYRCAKCRHTW